MLPTLRKYRPDLRVFLLDCGPTGLVACSRLDPGSDILQRRYHEIVDEMFDLQLGTLGMQQLWTLYPMIDTARLAANPADLTAVFNVW
jgi:hypothetical protein